MRRPVLFRDVPGLIERVDDPRKKSSTSRMCWGGTGTSAAGARARVNFSPHPFALRRGTYGGRKKKKHGSSVHRRAMFGVDQDPRKKTRARAPRLRRGAIVYDGHGGRRSHP